MPSKASHSGVWKWIAGILGSGVLITGIALGSQVLKNDKRLVTTETKIEFISATVQEIKTDVKALLSATP